LNFSEFQKVVNESKLNMTVDDVRQLFSVFDINRDGSISYDEFIRVVRGDMNEGRMALVHKAFEVLDKDGNGFVDFRDVCEVYDASKNPAVIDGRKTEE
jgi:Ca2+-binding EF-hand superfamily protein